MNRSFKFNSSSNRQPFGSNVHTIFSWPEKASHFTL